MKAWAGLVAITLMLAGVPITAKAAPLYTIWAKAFIEQASMLGSRCRR